MYTLVYEYFLTPIFYPEYPQISIKTHQYSLVSFFLHVPKLLDVEIPRFILRSNQAASECNELKAQAHRLIARGLDAITGWWFGT